MNEIENLYNKNYNYLLGNNISWLKEIRHSLLREINENGLPNKKDEIWKYSDLQKINKIKYKFNNNDENKYTTKNEDTIDLINGKYYHGKNIILWFFMALLDFLFIY